MYVDNMVAEAQKQKKRKPIIPGWLKAVMGIAAIIVCCVLPFFALEFVIGYFGEGTRPIPGDASNFDPIAVYPEVSKFAGENVRLQSIRIYYVRSDGTIDLGASYRPYVEYSFYRQLAAPPANAPPIGAGGSPNQTWYETITVNVSSPRSYHVRSGNSEYDY